MARTSAEAIDELERTGRVAIRAMAGGIAVAVLGALAFAAFGALLLVGFALDPSWTTVPAALLGAASFGFFGLLGVPVLVMRRATAARAVVLTAEGATLAGGSRVQWAHVRAARLVTLLGQRFAVVLPRPEHVADQLCALPPPARLGALLTGRLLRERAPVALPTQLELAPAELLRVVQHARRLGGHLR